MNHFSIVPFVSLIPLHDPPLLLKPLTLPLSPSPSFFHPWPIIPTDPHLTQKGTSTLIFFLIFYHTRAAKTKRSYLGSQKEKENVSTLPLFLPPSL